MAEYNSVPLGQAGTGAAYFLGPSKAMENWIAQDKQNSQVRNQNRINQLEFDNNLKKSYATNQFKGVPGLMWNAELQGKIDEHNKQGAEYLASGIDIYNPNFRDPSQVKAYQTYQQDRAMLNNMINAQKQFQEDSESQQKLAKGDPYAFTPESIASVADFEKGNTLYDVVSKGTKFPTLEKVFDYNKNITEQIPVLSTQDERVVNGNRIMEKKANVPAIEGFVNNLLLTGPNRNWLEKQIGGNVDGLLRTVDKDEIRKSLDAEFRSPTGVQLMAELKNAGKVPSYGSPEYNKFLDDATNEQLKAEMKFDQIASKAVQDGIAKANPSYKKVPDFSLARERRAQKKEMQNDVKFAERNIGNITPGASEPLSIPYANGEGVATSNDFVKMSSAGKNFAGSDAVDLSTGKPVRLTDSSNDYEIVGFGNFPFTKGANTTSTSKKGGKVVSKSTGKLEGALAQPKYVESNPNNVDLKPMIQVDQKTKSGRVKKLLVPFDRMPQNLSKQDMGLVNKFKAGLKGGKGQPAPSGSGMVTVVLNGTPGQIPANQVEAFLKKYPSAKRQ